MTTMSMTSTPASPSPLLLRIGEAATELGVSSTTVRRLLRAGRLRSVSIGKELRVPREALTEFCAS